ncbi:MAG: hypothetical protein CFE35_11620 [Novosphingobium sp. PASSN1]|nr:MAG: hypothetical protein CFE35_11620 [Novosphingobium sp. PASSN1]
MRQKIVYYQGVFTQLEDTFNAYEAGQITIRAYAVTVGELARAVAEQRALWLRLCDWCVVLRWVNHSERCAFRETVAALDWCRGWAMRQSGAHVRACIERARAEGMDQAALAQDEWAQNDERWSVAA